MAKNTNHNKRNWQIKIVALSFLLLFLLLLIEAGSRIFLINRYASASLVDFSTIIYDYYPKIKEINEIAPSTKDQKFDILLIGGSVLHPNNGEVEHELKKQLAGLESNTVITTYNAAIPGHTSRDSKLKMDLLRRKHFDLIIFYHGINEVRANNCVEDVFKQDYSHFKWYDEVNEVIQHQNSVFAAPLAFGLWKVNLKQRIFPHHYIPKEIPRNGWTEYGKQIKTEASFRINLESIREVATSMQSQLLVPTFTYYLPENYSFENFQKNKDRDERPRFPLKIWGKPQNVVNGIEAHNRVVLSLAKMQDDLTVIDLHAQMPKGDLYFDDICHLSEIGSKRFVEILMQEVSEILSDEDREEQYFKVEE